MIILANNELKEFAYKPFVNHSENQIVFEFLESEEKDYYYGLLREMRENGLRQFIITQSIMEKLFDFLIIENGYEMKELCYKDSIIKSNSTLETLKIISDIYKENEGDLNIDYFVAGKYEEYIQISNSKITTNIPLDSKLTKIIENSYF